MADAGVFRLTILYPMPSDPAAFDAYYREKHLQIAGQMKGLTGWRLQWLEADRDGTPPPYHLVVDLYAASREELFAILDSPEGLASSADVDNFAEGEVVHLFGVEEQVPVR